MIIIIHYYFKVQHPSVLWNLTLSLPLKAYGCQIWEIKAEYTLCWQSNPRHVVMLFSREHYGGKKGFKTKKKMCIWLSITCHQPQINNLKTISKEGNTRWAILPLFIRIKAWSSFIFGWVSALKSEKKWWQKITAPLLSVEEPLESRCTRLSSHFFKENTYIFSRFPKPSCEHPIGVLQESFKHIVPY